VSEITEKIYLNDAYKKEIEAVVTAVNSKEIELDRTIFYPTGGGVLNDTGTISLNGNGYKVIDVKKTDDKVIHILEAESDLKVGDRVLCRIDWDRRYALMRYHTATHVVGGVIEKKYDAMYTGGQIYTDRARFDFDIPNFSREAALEVLAESQKIIDANREVFAKILPKDKALAIPNLARTEPGRELLKKLDVIRVVEINDFDLQLDGGLHVANTSEIGRVELSNFENKGSKRKRMEIILK
jgi:misacylated tRNA(Ala) deacylase